MHFFFANFLHKNIHTKLKCQPQIILHHLGLQRSDLDRIFWILIFRLDHHPMLLCVHAAPLEDILHCPVVAGWYAGICCCRYWNVGVDLLFARFAVRPLMDGDNCFQLALERHRRWAAWRHQHRPPFNSANIFLDKVRNQNKVIFLGLCFLLW